MGMDASFLHIASSNPPSTSKKGTKGILKEFCPKAGFKRPRNAFRELKNNDTPFTPKVLPIWHKWCPLRCWDDTMGALIQVLTACYPDCGCKRPGWLVGTLCRAVQIHSSVIWTFINSNPIITFICPPWEGPKFERDPLQWHKSASIQNGISLVKRILQ